MIRGRGLIMGEISKKSIHSNLNELTLILEDAVPNVTKWSQLIFLSI